MTYMTPFERYQHEQRQKEEAAKPEPNKPSIPWSDKVLHLSKTNKSDQADTLTAWQREKAKQARGERNEIDSAEIDCAIKGYLNAWSKAVKEHRDLFRVSNGKIQYNWEEIKHLKEDWYARG
jgi:hypothetical protein